MSVRRENIEEQAMRLRGYVSEAVRTATGVNLPMTQTLDQMVRASAKAGVMLSISTEAQMHAIEMLSNQLRLHEISLQAEREQLRAEVAGLKTGYEAYERVNAELKAENEALRKELPGIRPFKPYQDSPVIGFTGCVICGVYTDHGGLPCPKTRATADAALGQGEQS